MRRFQTINLISGFLLLQWLFFVQPVLGDEGTEFDLSAMESAPIPGAAESKPEEGAIGSDPQKEGHFQLPSFSNDGDKESKPSAMGQFLSDIWTDQKAIWTSPVRMNRREFFTIALPLAAATAGLMATDSRTSKWLPNTRDQVNWSQRFSSFGAMYTLGLVTGGSLIGGKVLDKPDYTRIGRNAAEALVNSIITGYAIKAITGRERPNEGDGSGRFWKGGQSFPSGHTMNSWAVAVAIARTPNCPKWFAVTSYVMATAISASRWSAHKHFSSDILVGAVVGGLIGNYVAKRLR